MQRFNQKILVIAVIIVLFLISIHNLNIFKLRETDAQIALKIKNLGFDSKFKHFKINNRTIRCLLTGDTSKPAFFWLHGSPASLSGWEAIFTDTFFLKNYYLIMPDRTGYGYSDFGNIETNVNTQAEMMSQIVDSLGLKKYLLLGTSYGGPVAAAMAIRDSDKISKLLLVSASVKPKAELTYWISYPMTTPIVEWFFPKVLKMSSIEKLSHAEELAKLQNLEKIKCPTYILHGDKDPLIYFENAVFLKNAIPNSKLITLKDKGHSLIYSEPEYYKKVLKKVLAEKDITE